MEPQTLINILFGALGALLGFLLKVVWDRMDKLSNADQSLADKVQKIEVLVAGSYVTWTGLREFIEPIKEMLTRIEDKLDGKADKPTGGH